MARLRVRPLLEAGRAPEPLRDRANPVWCDPDMVARLCALWGIKAPPMLFEAEPWQRFDTCRREFCAAFGYLNKWGSIDIERAEAAGIDVSLCVRQRISVK